MKKRTLMIAGTVLAMTLACAGTSMTVFAEGETLVYGSGDYTDKKENVLIDTIKDVLKEEVK